MKRKTITSLVLMIIFSVAPVATTFQAHAEEGMWLPDMLDKLPLSQLKKRGFELKPDEVYSTAKPSLKDAIVQISAGGTGSFVSPNGLILTNHHVAFGAITRASSTNHDYINNGFLAKSLADEIPAQGYTISILQDYRDVTTEINAASTPSMSAQERDRAIATKKAELSKAAINGREKDGITAVVVDATSGYQTFLYTYLTLADVRLVYAPPKSVGYFGGDPDNFEWPRHCGDFSYLRAYVGKDGKPAPFGKDNVPFKPKRFLSLNAAGIKEGDFTFVLGHPGATYRYRESYSIDYRQNVQLPDQISSLRTQIAVLTARSEKSPELKIRLAEQIFGLSNTLKALEGAVVGLKKMNLIERKQAEEAALKKWIAASPATQAKYGDVLPAIAAQYADLRSFSSKQNVIAELLNSGDLISALEYAYNRALDKAKPENERIAQYGDAFSQRVLTQLTAGWNDRQVAVEAELLKASLDRAAQLPANQKFQFVDNLFANKSGEALEKAQSDFVQTAIVNSKYNSIDKLKELFSMSATDLRAVDDPALKLVIAAVDDSATFGPRVNKFNSEIVRLRPKFVAAMIEMKKSPYYPDANFTLRFTFGEIRGYKPRDAVSYDWQTSLRGVIEKDTGEDPFDVPQVLKELEKKRDFGSYVDPKLNDVPADFLSTTDITGGNSGSPIMNGKGEMIGLVFDGNYEGLAGDYAYDISLNRTIAVDIRYVLFLTEKMGGASYLFNEMQIKRGKAMAAGS